jgi:hypothetical protein
VFSLLSIKMRGSSALLKKNEDSSLDCAQDIKKVVGRYKDIENDL